MCVGTGVAAVSEEKIERKRVQGAELYCIPEVSPVGCISTDFELSETHGCLNPHFQQLPRISRESVIDGTSSRQLTFWYNLRWINT